MNKIREYVVSSCQVVDHIAYKVFGNLPWGYVLKQGDNFFQPSCLRLCPPLLRHVPDEKSDA